MDQNQQITGGKETERKIQQEYKFHILLQVLAVLLQMWPAKHCKGIQSRQLLQNHPYVHYLLSFMCSMISIMYLYLQEDNLCKLK